MSTNVTGRTLSVPLLRAKPGITPVLADATLVLSSLDDAELLSRIRNEDKGAALTLFRRYNKIAYSVGYRILRDEGEAEDLTQEVFLHLCSEVGTFDSTKGSARTWIVQMIYRRAFDRRGYLHRRHFYRGTDPEGSANTIVEARNCEAEMIGRVTVEQLKSVFSKLSDRQQKTLEAFFFEGLNFAEIAERSGEDAGNVRHHYYRGLERLRRLAQQMMSGRKFVK